MRAISTATTFIYYVQMLCIICALGLVILWGFRLEINYVLCTIALGVVVTTASFCKLFIKLAANPYDRR